MSTTTTTATVVQQVQPVIQRPLRGSRISTFYPVKSLPSLALLDSAFQLQEYISLLIRLDVHDVEAITALPGSINGNGKEDNKEREKETDKDKEVTVDEACWVYEQLRRLAQDLTHPLITTLQQECSSATCPEMKAGEWLYLCVAHGNDGSVEQCCAIDYILHTLDSATALLNSPRAFPSRLQIPQSSHRHFSSLARRLGRIFAHAYYHHREAFEQAEAESSLYARFLALSAKFDLVPSEFLVIPSSAVSNTVGEGGEEHEARGEEGRVEEAKDERGIDGGEEEEEEYEYGGRFDSQRGLGLGSVQNQGHDHHAPVPGLYPKLRVPLQHVHLQPRSQPHTTHLSHLHPQSQRREHVQSQPPSIGIQTPNQQQSLNTGTSEGDNPRRFGRNRTDTMVHSEVMTVVDDLQRAAKEKELERERETEKNKDMTEKDKGSGEEEAKEVEKDLSTDKDAEKREGEDDDDGSNNEEAGTEPAQKEDTSTGKGDSVDVVVEINTEMQAEDKKQSAKNEDNTNEGNVNENSESERSESSEIQSDEGESGSESEEMETATENSDNQSEKGDDDESEVGTESEAETASEGGFEDEQDHEKKVAEK